MDPFLVEFEVVFFVRRDIQAPRPELSGWQFVERKIVDEAVETLTFRREIEIAETDASMAATIAGAEAVREGMTPKGRKVERLTMRTRATTRLEREASLTP